MMNISDKRLRKGIDSPAWNGGKYHDNSKQRPKIMVYNPEHPRAHTKGYIAEHILIAEAALGGPLPEKAVVHHIDGSSLNNANANLIICDSLSYHRLIHSREIAYKYCGHANWRKCWYCQQYDDPNNLYIYLKGRSGFHRKCHANYERKRLADKKKGRH